MKACCLQGKRLQNYPIAPMCSHDAEASTTANWGRFEPVMVLWALSVWTVSKMVNVVFPRMIGKIHFHHEREIFFTASRDLSSNPGGTDLLKTWRWNYTWASCGHHVYSLGMLLASVPTFAKCTRNSSRTKEFQMRHFISVSWSYGSGSFLAWSWTVTLMYILWSGIIWNED